MLQCRLCLMMYRLFKNRLSNPEHIILKYTDDEGDLISMTDDTDVNHAISQSPLLKITVFDKETMDPEAPSLQDLQSQIKKLSEMLEKVMDTAAVKETNSGDNSSAAPEKTYRQLTTAEMAEFLDERKLDHINKKTETTSPASTGPQPIPSSSSQQPSAVPTPGSQPIQHQEPQRIPQQQHHF
ncbi:hypothetical protein K492DRAFT_75124 [Lichtheimia hyalospora FSU 10163]|nr:hypothetical protein K492DRAFT_75124 [Lichtheimia hyalospora FSU 10163]